MLWLALLVSDVLDLMGYTVVRCFSKLVSHFLSFTLLTFDQSSSNSKLICSLFYFICQGASAAATIAIDYRALRFYCYFYVRSVFAVVQSIRQRVTSTTDRSDTANAPAAGVVSYIQSLFSGGVSGDAVGASLTANGAQPIVTGHDNTVSESRLRNTVATSSASMSLLRGEGVERTAVCAACQSTSPEVKQCYFSVSWCKNIDSPCVVFVCDLSTDATQGGLRTHILLYMRAPADAQCSWRQSI